MARFQMFLNLHGLALSAYYIFKSLKIKMYYARVAAEGLWSFGHQTVSSMWHGPGSILFSAAHLAFSTLFAIYQEHALDKCI